MAWVIEGQTQSMIVQGKDTGMGSTEDELRFHDLTSVQISAMDTLLKLTSSWGGCTLVRTRLQGGAILARILSIFSTKHDEESWHASGLFLTESFAPLFSRKFTALKVVSESLLLLLNVVHKKRACFFAARRHIG